MLFVQVPCTLHASRHDRTILVKHYHSNPTTLQVQMVYSCLPQGKEMSRINDRKDHNQLPAIFAQFPDFASIPSARLRREWPGCDFPFKKNGKVV